MDVRCEQLIVGANLAQLPPVPEAQYLHANDFEHRVGGWLYTDILRVQATQPAWTREQVAADSAARHAEVGVTSELLLELAQDAAALPPAAIGAAYRRVLRFGCENAIEHETSIIARPLTDDASHTQARADAYARLGLALSRRAQAAALLDAGYQTSFDLFGVWHDQRPTTHRPPDPDRERVRAEQDILAGLIQYPDLAWVITGWLPDGVFTSRPRRYIYRTLTEDVLPSPQHTSVDSLRRGLQELHLVKCLHDKDRITEHGLLTTLAKAPITPGKAIRTAHEVYATDRQAAQAEIAEGVAA